MKLGSLQCIKKMYNINKSLKEFCNSVHGLIKNTWSVRWVTKYADILTTKYCIEGYTKTLNHPST